MNFKLPKNLGLLLCNLGIHKYEVIEIKFAFGTSGKVEIVECLRCKQVFTRSAR